MENVELNEQDLRHMSRKELVELLFAMKQREVELEQRLAEAERQLADKTIRVQRAGSIADAALALNNVFEAAQAAADDYLRSIKAANPVAGVVTGSPIDPVADAVPGVPSRLTRQSIPAVSVSPARVPGHGANPANLANRTNPATVARHLR